jgi:cap1 methyltransferase
LAALLSQKKGGMFILKFFDTYQTKTLQLIYLLRKCYSNLYFVKPYTSRPANSEKYLVCIDFLDNISKEEIHKLLLDIPRIGSTMNNQLEISKYNTNDIDFYQSIHEINDITFERQKEFILSTLELHKDNVMEQKKEELFKNQIMTSSEWCKIYGIKINYQSKFLNSFYRISNHSNIDC